MDEEPVPDFIKKWMEHSDRVETQAHQVREVESAEARKLGYFNSSVSYSAKFNPGAKLLVVNEDGQPVIFEILPGQWNGEGPHFLAHRGGDEFLAIPLRPIPRDDLSEQEEGAIAAINIPIKLLNSSIDEYIAFVDKIRPGGLEPNQLAALLDIEFKEETSLPIDAQIRIAEQLHLRGANTPRVIWTLLHQALRLSSYSSRARRDLNDLCSDFSFLKDRVPQGMRLLQAWTNYVKDNKLECSLWDMERFSEWLATRPQYRGHAISIKEHILAACEGMRDDALSYDVSEMFEGRDFDLWIAKTLRCELHASLAFLYLECGDHDKASFHIEGYCRHPQSDLGRKADFVRRKADILAAGAQSEQEQRMSESIRELNSLNLDLSAVARKYATVPADAFLEPALQSRLDEVKRTLERDWGSTWKRLTDDATSSIVLLHAMRESTLEKVAPALISHYLFRAIEAEIGAVIWSQIIEEERAQWRSDKDHDNAVFNPVLRIFEHVRNTRGSFRPPFIPKLLVNCLVRGSVGGKALVPPTEMLREIRDQRNNAIHSTGYSVEDSKQIRAKAVDSGWLQAFLVTMHSD